MRAALGELSVIHHDDGIAVTHRAESVCDHHTGTAAPTDILDDPVLRDRIKRACRLIHDEDGRVDRQCAGDLDPLTLTARQVHTVFLDHHIKPVGLIADKIIQAGIPRRIGDIRIRDLRIPHRDIIAQRAREQRDILADCRDAGVDDALRYLGQIGTVQTDLALARTVQSADELCDRRFTAAGRADDRHHRTGIDLQREIVDQRLIE